MAYNYNFGYDNIDDIKISKINSAGLQNLSLHELWKEARNHARAGNFQKWNADLDMIWGELFDFDFKSKKENNPVEEFNKLNEVIYKLGTLNPPAIIGFSDNRVLDDIRAKQYLALLKKHVWLKKLQNIMGKGTAYRDPYEDEFE